MWDVEVLILYKNFFTLKIVVALAGLLLGEKGELVFTVLGVLLCCETVKVLLRIALDILRGRPEKKN